MMGEYDKVLLHGRTTDRRTATMVHEVERRLGAEFYCYQGSYSTAVAASGSTHAGGGVVDLNTAGKDPDMVTRALRNQGFAAWYRKPSQGFTTHIHAVDIGNERLSSDAATQVRDYRDGGSGLWPISGGNDPQPYRPTSETYAPFVTREGFDYDAFIKARTLRQKANDLFDRIKALRRARRQVRNQIDRLS